jgi:hypothetical protein
MKKILINTLWVISSSLISIFYTNTARSANFVYSNSSLVGQKLFEASENQWVSLNDNKFNEVWTPKSLRPTTEGSPASIILAWGSMAWDSNRGDLIFFGGGHANYAGNDIYRWRASTLKWERASLPSAVTRISGGLYTAIDGVDNAPISSHTYDSNEFLPVVDRFVTFGGAAYQTGGGFQRPDGSLTGPYFWDPSKADANKVGGSTGSQVDQTIAGGNMWQNRDNRVSIPTTNNAFAYTNENGKDVLFIQGGNTLLKYTVNDLNDPSSDSYEVVGQAFQTFSGKGAGAYSPFDNMFVRSSGGTQDFNIWLLDDLTGQAVKNINIKPSDIQGGEGFDFTKLGDYGIDFDPVRDRFVLWGGGADVWALIPGDDPSAATGWEMKLLTDSFGSGDGFPNLADIGAFTGVLGKWKYSKELDAFLGVVDPINGDVWAYKPNDWQPSIVPIPGAFYLFFAGLTLLIAKKTRS